MIHEAAIHALGSFQLVQLLHKAVVAEDGPINRGFKMSSFLCTSAPVISNIG
jgi:hypothetical protein